MVVYFIVDVEVAVQLSIGPEMEKREQRDGAVVLAFLSTSSSSLLLLSLHSYFTATIQATQLCHEFSLVCIGKEKNITILNKQTDT